MNGMQSLLALVGRLFLALIFIASMFHKLTNWESSIQYMESHNSLLPVGFTAGKDPWPLRFSPSSP